ncbi:hypothetical protein LAZ67_23000924 [Cordylochernes scorpioides]|uniref:N-acetyltransferase domain-containing protein n=1 Tax=Cordylochernes scorpioides TaxID=51811 RepID=A0ABY6LQC7_9ARAC|nr:hypothetical protein LAZ67_23000924 [Cordylochernes scorpioides]
MAERHLVLKGIYEEEIVPVLIESKRKGLPDGSVSHDEEVDKINFEKLSSLKTPFVKENGTVTAANASSLSDGAAACVLMTQAAAERLQVHPLAKIIDYADAALDPIDFPIAPAKAIEKRLNHFIFPVSYNAKFYRDVLEAGELAKLAYYNDIVVGAVCCREDISQPGCRRLYIMTLGCLVTYRRQGIGTALLEHVLNYVEHDSNFSSVFLHVQVNNDTALAFYQKFGFEIIGIEEHYYQRIEPADAFILQKPLLDKSSSPQQKNGEQQLITHHGPKAALLKDKKDLLKILSSTDPVNRPQQGSHSRDMEELHLYTCRISSQVVCFHVRNGLKLHAKSDFHQTTKMEDQQICIKFCVKNGFKGAENFWMLQTASGDAVMSRRRVFECYKRFKEGRQETSDNERSGRPSTSTTPEKVDKVLELVHEDRRITVREVAEEAGISFGLTQSIMKDILGVRRLNAVLVPKDLTFDQKNARKETASLNLEATTDDPESLKRVITGDETWIYGFDSETTQQESEWRFKNEPRPKKARKAPSKVKVMLMVFFDYQGIVHHEFQQQGSIITADSYLGVLRRLREAIRQKRPELWRSKSWILHHDNALAHTALKISNFLQDHSTSVFPQPPYSPDLAPCDFFLLES